MSKFLKNPNLPRGKVTAVLVDYRINPLAVKNLEKFGITVYKTRKTDALYNAVSGHPDMVIHHLGDDKFVVSPENADFYRKILKISPIIGSRPLVEKYPNDILYNAARIGHFLIHNFKYTDGKILQNSVRETRINVSQGYSKCSVCIVAENAMITSDAGIAKAVSKYDIDVLLVNDEKIVLHGVSHGFIGGASGLIAPDLLAVNGNISNHINFRDIECFCHKHGVKLLSLHNGEIEDIGSIIPLEESD